MFDFRRFIRNNRRLVSGLGMLLAILLIVVYKDEELSFLSLSSFLGKGGKTGE